MSSNAEKEEGELFRVIFDVEEDPDSYVSTRPEDNGALYRHFIVTFLSPLHKHLFVQAIFNGPTDPNFHAFVNEFRSGAENGEEDASTTDSSSETEIDVVN